jgi:hypothetical protein
MRWVLAVAIPLVLVLALAASSWFWQWPVVLKDLLGLTAGSSVEIVIASPSDGSEVFLGQEVAVEATLLSGPELPATDRVELRVNGTVVSTQPLGSNAGTDRAALPVSLVWLPTEVAEVNVEVIAVTAQGDVQGQANIRLTVTEAASEAP